MAKLDPQGFTKKSRMGGSDNITVAHKNPKVGRNEPCPCGSGKKYKKCCLGKSETPVIQERDELDALMREGYSLLHEQKTMEACDVWVTLWNRLKARFRPEFANIEEAGSVFSGREDIYNWCQDFEAELGNAGLDNSAYYQRRIEYCTDFCSIFPESDDLLMHNMKRAIAESHFSLGDTNKGEECFEQLIESYPENIWGYIGWGDMYLWPRKEDIDPDYEKAEKIYKMALGMDLEEETHLIARIEESRTKREKGT